MAKKIADTSTIAIVSLNFRFSPDHMIETSAVCTRIERSDSGLVTFVYFRPEKTFLFAEGQFMFLEVPGRMRSNGKVMKNAYSIGTTSRHLEKKNEIGFIVKKASDDGVSNFLTMDIQEGDTIVMKWPLGHFDLAQSGDRKSYLMISIGSGVTPIYSIYEHIVHETEAFDKIANLFGERYLADVLQSVSNMFSDDNEKIKNYICLSREENMPGHYYSGYIQQQLDQALEFLGDSKDVHVFLCGKPMMCDAVKATLLERGFGKDQLSIEKY